MMFKVTAHYNCAKVGFRHRGWRRPQRLFHVDVDPDDVKAVLTSQTAVLVLPVNDRRAFSSWRDTRLNLEFSRSRPKVLPFVDRLEAVTSMTLAMVGNLALAEDIQAGLIEEKKSICLVGSGALYGAGKTKIGSILHQCVQEKLGYNRKVVRVTSEVGAGKSTYLMWVDDVCSVPEMESLATIIHKDMIFGELVRATERYLSQRNLVMFLHLDEFAPFDDTGRKSNTQRDFDQCWRLMLMPILYSPSICLYISGRMPYFDSIADGTYGQPPCAALSEQLDLFSAETIHKMLEKIFIPLNTTTESDTVTLSRALNQLFLTGPGQTVRHQQGSWEIAQRVHAVTGGVPRFVQYALHALLVNSDIYQALFKCDGTVPSDTLLDEVFNKDGDVYHAVKKAARIHFNSIGVAEVDTKDDAERFVGLVQLVSLRERTFPLSPQDIMLLTEGMFPLEVNPISELISHAQFWGIHRSIDKRKGLISFAVPSAVLDGLASVLAYHEDLWLALQDEQQEPGTTRA